MRKITKLTILGLCSAVLLAVVALLLSAVSASATPNGTLATTVDGITVTPTTIDWLPAGGGTGGIATTAPTNVTYTGGGPLLPGSTGLIKDLIFSDPLPVMDFMTFTGHSNLHFDLFGIGAGVANTLCPNTFDPNDPVCSFFLGSPFILHAGSAGTTLTLNVFGLARDASATSSAWQGGFSFDFAGETPFDLQGQFLGTGTITSPHSGAFVDRVGQQPVPEPATMLLVGSGLLGLVGYGRKKFFKK